MTRAVLYGYRMVNGVIEIDDAEAEVVKRIYADRLSGIGVYAIGKKLYEQHIPFFCTTRDKAIKKASAILYKDAYCGNKGYPAIVSREDFDRVAAMKAAPFRKTAPNPCDDVYTPIKALNTSYEPNRNVTTFQEQIEHELAAPTKDSTAIRSMILKLCSMKYDCIRTED